MFKGIDTLHEQLETHKKTLKQVDDSIKKLGKSEANLKIPQGDEAEPLNENNPVHKPNSNNRSVHLSNDSNDRNLKRKNNDDNRSSKRLSNGRNYETNEDEDDLKKPTLQSSVVSKSTNIIKSKEDLIKMQNKHTGSEQRNKRILGVILGTLKQFKTDDKERSCTTQAQSRKELEKKIEIKKVEEKKKF